MFFHFFVRLDRLPLFNFFFSNFMIGLNVHLLDIQIILLDLQTIISNVNVYCFLK